MSPDITLVAVVVLGAFAAAFVAGVAGFGDAVVASAIWLQFLSPIDTVTLVVASFFVMHVVMLAMTWKKLHFGRLWPFLIAGTVGVPIGAQLLNVVSPGAFKVGAGVFLVIYGFSMLKLMDLPPLRYGGSKLDAGIGFIGGVLGGLAGLSGFIPAVWCTQRGWPKMVARGVTQPFIMAMHGMALGWLAYGGHITQVTTDRLMIALPAIAAGAWFGFSLYRLFDEKKFRQTVLLILAGAGVILLLNPGGH